MTGIRRCQRFREDGSACTNETVYADGWCRSPDCPGFRRAERTSAPSPTTKTKRGTAKHIRESGGLDIGDLIPEDVPSVEVTRRAVEGFQSQHGGTAQAAAVELRSMLEDFLLKSSRRVTKRGFVLLARDGYELTLSRDLGVITNYATVHRERSWSQLKAGVRSRFPGTHGKKRGRSGIPPEPGPQVTPGVLFAVFDPQTVHLTGRARTAYARLLGLAGEPDEVVDAALRAAVASLSSGAVTRREDGMLEATTQEHVWLISADAFTIVGVKRRLHRTMQGE